MKEKTGRQYMNKKIKASAAIVAALALSLGAFAANTASAATTVKIAYQGPLTGPEAQTGTDSIRGVKLAIKIYNATNPAVKVEIFEGDDQGDDAQGGTVGAGIAADDAVIGVLTAYSGPTIAALPSYKAKGIAIVSPSATRASLTDPTSKDYGNPVFHRIVSNDDLQGPALARVATNGVKDPTVFVVDDQSSYSVGLTKAVKLALGTAFQAGDSAAKGAVSDFSATIAKIKKEKANVVIYTGYYADGAKFLKQLRDKGYKGVYAAGDGVLNSQFPKLAGKKQSEGARLTAPTVPLEVASPKITAMFKKDFKADPGVYTTEAFDATNIFLQGIKAGKTTRADMLAYLNSASFSYKNTAGVTLKFQESGDLSGSGLMNQFVVKGGTIKLNGKA
jgi:branched-chain amino acid transport system substrate-binding protein